MNNPTPSEDRGVGPYSNEYPGIFAVHISELALVIFVSKTPIILKGNSGVTSETISDSAECYAGISVRFESSAACM